MTQHHIQEDCVLSVTTCLKLMEYLPWGLTALLILFSWLSSCSQVYHQCLLLLSIIIMYEKFWSSSSSSSSMVLCESCIHCCNNLHTTIWNYFFRYVSLVAGRDTHFRLMYSLMCSVCFVCSRSESEHLIKCWFLFLYQ